MEKKKVKICGVEQNIYKLDYLPAPPLKKKVPQAHYPSLERKQLDNGYTEAVEMKDYPINESSIASYVDGADYHRDPMAAIQNAPKRVNLGDITEVQRFIQTNPQEAVRVYNTVGEKLKQYFEEKKNNENGVTVDNGTPKEGE